MHVLIIGGGISGCVLMWTLHNKGIQTTLLDDGNTQAASRVAAGIITPIVPKRFALTWQHNTVLPVAHTFYSSLQRDTDDAFYTACSNNLVADSTTQMNDWLVRADEIPFAPYIYAIHKPDNTPYIHAPFGAVEIAQAAVINTPAFIQYTHSYFNVHRTTTPLVLDTDNVAILKKEYQADVIVLCTGWYPANADAKVLPFNPAKGETITIRLKEGALNNIVQKNIYIAPVSPNICKVGATYSWDILDALPTAKAREHLIYETEKLLSIPFEVLDHHAAVRPATHARRPVIGPYENVKDVYVMNGMGTKGLLLAPYCAEQLAAHILHGTEINKEIDIRLQRKR